MSTEAGLVARTLAEEVSVVTQFVEALRLEQTALSAGNTDDLPAYAEKKGRLAVALDRLAAQRNSSLASLGLAANRPGVEAWCARFPAEVAARKSWSEILLLASEARELNRLNGELIQLRMQFNAEALKTLQGHENLLDLYGPDGQSTAPGRTRIHHAV